MSSAKRTAAVIRHVSFEDLGLLSAALDPGRWAVSFCDAAIDDLTDVAIAGADLLIVLGGPIGAYQGDIYPFLRQETALLERRLGAGRPTLGICLGAQLMAAALGARVYPGPVKEIGWGRLALTPAGRASCLAPLAEEGAEILHWHGDTFDLPHGAVRLAANEHYENQAFAHGGHALGLQFHAEADPRLLEEWYVGHAAELAGAGIDVPALRAGTAARAPRVRAQAQRIFQAWLAGV